eukprot:764084-Hanusia_phi.AAC.1
MESRELPDGSLARGCLLYSAPAASRLGPGCLWRAGWNSTNALTFVFSVIKAHDGPVEGIATVASARRSSTPLCFVSLGRDARVKLWKLNKQSEDGCLLSSELNLMDFRVSLAPDVSGCHFPNLAHSFARAVVVVQYQARGRERGCFLHHGKVAERKFCVDPPRTRGGKFLVVQLSFPDCFLLSCPRHGVHEHLEQAADPREHWGFPPNPLRSWHKIDFWAAGCRRRLRCNSIPDGGGGKAAPRSVGWNDRCAEAGNRRTAFLSPKAFRSNHSHALCGKLPAECWR